MVTFTHEKISPTTTRIHAPGMELMYLVEGAHTAALIDTGSGIGYLRAYVERLTDKPLIVLLTHGHVDHAMGAGPFERVYMSPLDEGVYLEHSKLAVRKDYAMSNNKTAKISDTDFTEPLPFTAFRPLHPGNCFDLGGVSVQVLEGRGHTPGSVTLLIPELQVLILGDACNDFTFLFLPESSPVSEYRQMLIRLNQRTRGTYSRVLVSHGRGEGACNMIDEVIAVCDQILIGNSDAIPFKGFGGIDALIAKTVNIKAFCREDGRAGNVVYNPKKL